jgi:hypothetical protein
MGAMMQSEAIDQLATALAAAQAELLPALKDVDGQVGRQSRKYADLASCWEAIRVCLPRHGLAIVQTARSEGDCDYLDTTLCHASGQWIRGTNRLLWGENPALTPMQCYGSALTYARRYGLAAICGLTAEDDDAKGAGNPKPERRDPEPRPQPPARPPGRDMPARANGVPATVANALDKLTGRYLERMTAAGLVTGHPDATRFELWNHLASEALDPESGLDIDPAEVAGTNGKRDQQKAVRMLRRLAESHREWVTNGTQIYLEAKLTKAQTGTA